MSVLEALTDAERYLVAILQDSSGVDIAEFLWKDPDQSDSLFRCYDYQYAWYRNDSKQQIDQCGRSVGKSVGIQMRAFAFPFVNAGNDMMITAPEMIHLDPVTKHIEDRLMSTRLSREMLKSGNQSTGITHRPFEAKFRNDAKIVGRIPQKDGKGVKGSVVAGTLVTTPIGHLPIEKISEGDLVLTGEGRFMPVVKTFGYEADTVIVAGAGHRGIQVSGNHRFQTRRNSNPQRTRRLAAPGWMGVDSDEYDRHYWATPVGLPVVPLPGQTPWDEDQSAFWLAGRYVADGNLGIRDGWPRHVAFTADVARIGEIATMIKMAGLTGVPRAHDNAACVVVHNTQFAHWLHQGFGHHADQKRLPIWLHRLPRYLLDAFLDGYLRGDGHWNPTKDRWEIGTASKELAIGMRLLGNQLGYTTSFSWVDPRPNALCAAPLRSWRVQWSKGHALTDYGHAWQKIRSIQPGGLATVHDLIVLEDHSYVADGIVHRGGVI